MAGVAVCLVPALRDGAVRLWQFYGHAQPRTALAEWNVAGGGERVLPAKVQTMLALLRENHIAEFRVSEAVLRDPDDSVPQRLAEGAYPIRVNLQSARHWLRYASEGLPAGCRTIAVKQEVVLADCG